MNRDLFTLSAYWYDLPKELIAQNPLPSREDSRLMIIDRSKGTIDEILFREISDFLHAGDSLVLNDTKVISARLFGKKKTGGKLEILLLKNYADGTWDALVKPAKKAPLGTVIEIGENFSCEIISENEAGSRRLAFKCENKFEDALAAYGQMPLPPYIERKEQVSTDNERYQTVYAKNLGAVAAPTAGLHFSQPLLEGLAKKGVELSCITLHVGLGTFLPVQTHDIREHRMHRELFIISPETAGKLNNRSKSHLHICVGTTSCRALESAANAEGLIIPGEYETDIFIYPGYKFKYVQSLLTNFHLPGSTLLMLVSAFAGYDLIKEAYAKAIERKFRFFSYGDAMLIL